MDSSSASVLKERSPGVYRANLSARARAKPSKRGWALALSKRSPRWASVEDSVVFGCEGSSVAVPHCCRGGEGEA
eukprot:3723063-Pleurochrysis_carterae.AAC.1